MRLFGEPEDCEVEEPEDRADADARLLL